MVSFKSYLTKIYIFYVKYINFIKLHVKPFKNKGIYWALTDQKSKILSIKIEFWAQKTEFLSRNVENLNINENNLPKFVRKISTLYLCALYNGFLIQ